MTPVQLIARLDSVQRSLRTLGLTHVAVWAIGALALVLGSGVIARMLAGSPELLVVWLLGIAVASVVAWWRWHLLRPDRVMRIDAALWAERQAPNLRYALVTLADRARVDDIDPTQRRLASFMAATDWQAHSVRGFISGTLGKKMGLAVLSEKGQEGERVYSIE